MKPSKPLLVAGGLALAIGAIWYIKKSEKPSEEFIPTVPTAPATYLGSQEAAGNFGNFGSGGAGNPNNLNTGGGAPTTPAEGVTTAPPEEHVPAPPLTPEQKKIVEEIPRIVEKTPSGELKLIQEIREKAEQARRENNPSAPPVIK